MNPKELLKQAILKSLDNVLSFNDMVGVHCGADILTSAPPVVQYRLVDIYFTKEGDFNPADIGTAARQLVTRFLNTYIEGANKRAEMREPAP